MRTVNERDFRMPEFIDANPEDYEFRADGKIVRKDRWEQAVQKIRNRLGDNRREFEIQDIINAVEALVDSLPHRDDVDEFGEPLTDTPPQ